jgi:phosphatidate cytidylyltransferase
MPGESSGAFQLRVITGLSLLGLVLLLVWHPHSAFRGGFTLFVGVIAGVGLFEYYALARARSLPVEAAGGTVIGVLVVLTAHFGHLAWVNAALYAGCIVVAALQIVHQRQSIPGLTASIFGLLYVGWFAAHFVLLRTSFAAGAGLVTLLIVAVAVTDTAAYFTGRAVGRHKLTPLSPKKTWEGAAGGFVFTMVGVVFIHYLRQRYQWPALPAWTFWQYAVAGALLSVTSQIGDIAESLLKRDAGVKDSGAFFPGHGGVLDRCDGFLFAAPALYYMAVLIS